MPYQQVKSLEERLEVQVKRCYSCGKDLPFTDFFNAPKLNDGKRSSCKICEQNRVYKWKSENKDKTNIINLRSRLKQHFNITLEQYYKKLEIQGVNCANPGCNNKHSALDHDRNCCPSNRSCGKCIRDFLCDGCNMAFGILGEDIDRISGLIEYKSRWS